MMSERIYQALQTYLERNNYWDITLTHTRTVPGNSHEFFLNGDCWDIRAKDRRPCCRSVNPKEYNGRGLVAHCMSTQHIARLYAVDQGDLENLIEAQRVLNEISPVETGTAA